MKIELGVYMNTGEDIKMKMALLSDSLLTAQQTYHTNSVSIMTDSQYDQGLKELRELEEKHPEFKMSESPTDRVGGEVLKGFNTVVFDKPMLSLSNAFNAEDISKFYRSLGLSNRKVVCEPKLDGIALSLFYEDGVLVKASTRGDGKKGEDVTNNAKTIPSIPLVLNTTTGGEGRLLKKIEIRGEVTMPKAVFEKLNIERTKKGIAPFSSPRNAASGSMRQLDSKETGKRGLEFTPYDVISEEPIVGDSYFDNITFLDCLGFNSMLRVRCVGVVEINDFIATIQRLRDTLPMVIDGVVVKLDSLSEREKIGYTKTAPKWATAYKYKARDAVTTLSSVSFTVGRTGIITPVANIELVELDGVKVTAASLYNEDELDRLDLRIGDKVIVGRMGDVIPKIISVVPSEGREAKPRIDYPTVCPACSTPTLRREGEVATRCPNNTHCEAQFYSYVQYATSRECLDIKGLGPSIIKDLISKGIIKRIADIYLIEDPESLPKGLWESIQKSRTVSLDRFIKSLGILSVGLSTSLELAEHYKTIDNFLENIKEDQSQTPRISRIIREYFSDEERYDDTLILSTVLSVLPHRDRSKGALAGMKIVVTGSFDEFSRSEIEALLTANGAVIGSRVDKLTSLLLMGESGGRKAKDAQNLGVKILLGKEAINYIKLLEKTIDY